jgi:hypothetical protein
MTSMNGHQKRLRTWLNDVLKRGAHWEISLQVKAGYKAKFSCRECGKLVEQRKQSEHQQKIVHKAKKPAFDQV